MKLVPLGQRLIIKLIENNNVTKSGIILKDSSTEGDLNCGLVVEVSKEITELSKNDKIYYSKFKGEQIKFLDEEYIILELKDVIAKEEN